MKASIVYVYNSFKDPLFQATLWLYLKEEAKNNRLQFHLVTYEQDEWKVTEDEKKEITNELNGINILWYPLRWRSGRFKIVKKLFDLIDSIKLIRKIIKKYKPNSIISLGTVAGSFAYLIAILFKLKTYIYQYERHSEFLVDFNIWSKHSISYRLLHYLERKSGNHASILATGTTHMMDRLKKEGSKAQIYLLPSCVDDLYFNFDEEARNEIRKSLGIFDRRIIIYLGKFGGIYYDINQMSLLFRDWLKVDNKAFFLILSPQPGKEISDSLLRVGLDNDSFWVSSTSHKMVPKYLSAADFGIVAVPPLPSQKYRSPIKVGEYLCCGLPYLVVKGISNDDQVAIEKNVGVVVETYDQHDLQDAIHDIIELIDEPRDERLARYRSAGVEYRGFSKLKETSEMIFNQISTW